MKLNEKTRRKANAAIFKLATFHDTQWQARDAVETILTGLGVEITEIQEVGTRYREDRSWRGTMATSEGEVSSCFILWQTHDMPSGRVELNAYIS